MKILGLGHYSRTGKDTLAKFVAGAPLRDGPRVKIVALAQKLKEICHDLYAWAGVREPEFYDTEDGQKFRDVKIPALDMTPVELWVAMGTPAIREVVYDRTWVDYLLKSQHDCDLLIVPDVRFPNEVQAFREHGAKLVKVVRKGRGPRDTVADRALLSYGGWDLVAGPTLEDLASTGVWLARWAAGEDAFPKQTKTDRARRLAVEKA